MSKKGIISLSILVIVIALIGVLFGAVFCLRTQNVSVLGDSPVAATKEEIISTAGLKNGKSIFMLDKDTAIQNIEKTYPTIKVVQIKTTSVTTIEICVRARHEMYYTEYNDNFYILDEDLKVLEIIDTSLSEETDEPTHLTHIENGVLNISASTKQCDFVGTSYQQSVAYNLYTAMITTVTKQEGEGEQATEVYLTREDVCEMIRDVQFESYKTFNKIIITTKYGVKLDIENPSENLQNKINICFSTIKQLNGREQNGTIKIYYDLENVMQCIYIPAETE